jgi:hypothetical protein
VAAAIEAETSDEAATDVAATDDKELTTEADTLDKIQ